MAGSKRPPRFQDPPPKGEVRRILLWPKQITAYTTKATEVLFGGAAGPGKSHLMRISMLLSCAAIPGLQCYLFRRRYGDLIKNHLEGSSGLRELVATFFKEIAEIVDLEVRFKNGSRIYLSHCQHEKDVENYRGAEIHFLGVEEATQFTEYMIRFLRTRVRMPLEFKERLPAGEKERWPRILYTSNPGGPGHGYFKQMFIDAAPPESIWRTPDSEGAFLRQYLPAKLTDNPSINPEEYRKTLRGLGSPELVKALEEGDWSALVGAYFTVFRRDKHIVPPFTVPPGWYKYRAFDWGSYKPFCVLWIAVADGQPVRANDGQLLRFPRGALCIYREWYGMAKDQPDVGIGLRNEDIAEGIIRRTKESPIAGTVTDSLPFQDRGGRSIADVFRDGGVPLTQGDTSRVPGWSQVLSRLIGGDEGPMLYIVDTCIHTIRTLPVLVRSLHDPDDIEDGQEDHAADCVRLACTAKPLVRDREREVKTEVRQELTIESALKQHLLEVAQYEY